MKNYLVIAPSLEHRTLEPLLDLRRSQGLTVQVLAAEEVTSINAVVRERQPDYVLLFGAVSGDTPYDNDIADFDGDHMPDVAVGRIGAEGVKAREVVQKLIGYELDSGGEWQTRAIFSDGDPSWGRPAAWASDLFVKARAPKANPAVGFERVSFNPASGSITGAKSRADFLLSQGVLYLGYNGHGHAADTDILGLNDLAALEGGPGNPIMLFAACLTGRDLAHRVVVDGPAIAGVGALDLTATANPALSETFQREVIDGPAATVGGAFVRTKRALGKQEVGGAPGVLLALGEAFAPDEFSLAKHLDTYQLYGDPATRIRRPTPIGVGRPSALVAGREFTLPLGLPRSLRSGTATLYLERVLRDPGDRVVARLQVPIEQGRLARTAVLPAGTPFGQFHLRVVVENNGTVGAGAAPFVEVQRNGIERASD